MVEISADKAALFLDGRVVLSITSLGLLLVMIVIAPLRKMVCEFEARCIGGCVFEVDDYELFVGVRW